MVAAKNNITENKGITVLSLFAKTQNVLSMKVILKHYQAKIKQNGLFGTRIRLKPKILMLRK